MLDHGTISFSVLEASLVVILERLVGTLRPPDNQKSFETGLMNLKT